jgi:hypothetical protein
MKGHFVEPQEIAPQVERGCDHSNTGIVLVRFGKFKLVWRKGGGVWNGIGMGRRYAPCSLQVLGAGTGLGGGMGEDIFEGGRLGMYRIAPEIKKIRGFMGLPDLDVQHINFKKTYIVEEA